MNRLHIFYYTILRVLVVLYLKIKFGYRYQKIGNISGNYIVLSNHTTDFDPLFVAASFPRQMYFVASEHIARWKYIYAFLKHTLAPIMRYKGTLASSTVMEVLRKVKKGASVCIFAEGVRSWDGVTGPILPSTAKLIKSAGCALVTYKITGGYFISPGWCEGNLRKGPVSGAPVHIYTKEALAAMTLDEIYQAITRDLYEDAYANQITAPQKYTGKALAEPLENLLFICPTCGSYDTIQTRSDSVSCTSCNTAFQYNEYAMLENAPFQTVYQLSQWQKERVQQDVTNGIIYHVPFATLSTVAGHEETLVTQGPLQISSDTLSISDMKIPLKEISDMAIHGRHALVFTAGRTYYELKPSKEANTLKFLLYYRAWKNTQTKEN